MSTVFLHVGQCGNQVGHSFWKKATKDEKVSTSRTFIHADGKQRSVHVDSEPKVINRISKGSEIREGNVVFGKRGRGTNWALGYYGLKNKEEDHLVEETVERLRKEIERCDSYSGCVMMHSLSGGTGSGLGSKFCEIIRDEYPMSHLISCCFAPCATGESPLQHYNSLLTMAQLNRYADCTILTHNDIVLGRLQKKLETVSFTQMNDLIAASLCGVFLPTDTLTTKSGTSIGSEPWELLRSLCPYPANKVIQINHLARRLRNESEVPCQWRAPQVACINLSVKGVSSHSKLSWEALMSQLLLSVNRYDNQGKNCRSISNVIIARGDSTGSFPAAMKTLEKKVKTAYNCVPWNPYPLDVWTARQNLAGYKSSLASITIASNHSSIIDYMDTMLMRSRTMYDVGAYLHWYWRHGASQEDFTEAFEEVAMVIQNYKDAIQ